MTHKQQEWTRAAIVRSQTNELAAKLKQEIQFGSDLSLLSRNYFVQSRSWEGRMHGGYHVLSHYQYFADDCFTASLLVDLL
jgi:hypothetical protein